MTDIFDLRPRVPGASPPPKRPTRGDLRAARRRRGARARLPVNLAMHGVTPTGQAGLRWLLARARREGPFLVTTDQFAAACGFRSRSWAHKVLVRLRDAGELGLRRSQRGLVVTIPKPEEGE